MASVADVVEAEADQRQHFAFQLEHDKPAVPVHAEQIEKSAVGRRLASHQRQA